LLYLIKSATRIQRPFSGFCLHIILNSRGHLLLTAAGEIKTQINFSEVFRRRRRRRVVVVIIAPEVFLVSFCPKAGVWLIPGRSWSRRWHSVEKRGERRSRKNLLSL